MASARRQGLHGDGLSLGPQRLARVNQSFGRTQALRII